MNHKLMGMILSLLMTTCLISVGFASWTIVNVGAYEEITGDIQSEDIIDVGSYLKMPTPAGLKYNKDGFLGTDKYNSEITAIGYNLDIKKAKEEMNAKAIDIVIKLNYIDLVPSSMNIFNHIEVMVYHNNDLLTANVSSTRNDISIITTISLADEDMINDNYIFDIKYKFSLDETYFNNPLSPLWSKSQPVFKISAILQFK